MYHLFITLTRLTLKKQVRSNSKWFSETHPIAVSSPHRPDTFRLISLWHIAPDHIDTVVPQLLGNLQARHPVAQVILFHPFLVVILGAVGTRRRWTPETLISKMYCIRQMPVLDDIFSKC